MEFFSRITTQTDTQKIVRELTEGLEAEFDLGFLFISSFGKTSTEEIIELINRRIKIKNLLGCTCAGIIGEQTEIERQPATSLILAKLPGVKILAFCINQTQMETLSTPEAWFNFLEVYPNENPIFLILPDPFQFDMNRFLDQLNKIFPHCSIVGGLASGAYQPLENTLFLNQKQFEEGLVGVILTGPIQVEAVVSQGCRPIGETYIVTKAQDNVVHELAGKPFIEVLQNVLYKIPAKDKLLAQEALFVGIAMNEYQHQFKRGDFLIRGLIGIDRNTGAGAIADYVKPGQTIQFHIRDAEAATEDLNELLSAQQNKNKEKPKGALVFSCNGRGENLFRQPNHDIQIIQKYLGPVPAAGFFCAGEIGPVCKNNFLHGFTSSIALFYPKVKT